MRWELVCQSLYHNSYGLWITWTTISGTLVELVEALALAVLGGLALRFGLKDARRHGLFTRSFWGTFFAFARYRGKRLLPLGLSITGGILLIGASIIFYGWLRAYYAARLGHPFP